jgi:hypothetical protein
MKPQIQYMTVQAANLLNNFEAHVKLPFAADWIALPEAIPDFSSPTGVIFSQSNGDSGAEFGVRINDPSAPMLLFTAATGGLALSVFEGTVTDIYICEIAHNAALPVTFIVGKDCNIGFAKAVFG